MTAKHTSNAARPAAPAVTPPQERPVYGPATIIPGEYIAVYSDVISRQALEGIAIVKRVHDQRREAGGVYSDLSVEFLENQGSEYRRQHYNPDANKAVPDAVTAALYGEVFNTLIVDGETLLNNDGIDPAAVLSVCNKVFYTGQVWKTPCGDAPPAPALENEEALAQESAGVSKIDMFMAAYELHLKAALIAAPNKYAYKVDALPRILVSVRQSILSGNYASPAASHSPAFLATFKQFNIPVSPRKAIKEWLAS